MNRKAYSNTRAIKSKMAKGCFAMWFSAEGKAGSKNMADDLNRLGAYFAVKPVQILETNSSMVFPGLPINTDP